MHAHFLSTLVKIQFYRVRVVIEITRKVGEKMCGNDINIKASVGSLGISRLHCFEIYSSGQK